MLAEQSQLTSVAVFCASSRGDRPELIGLAKDLGEHLARENMTIVFGGSDAGLMGVVADAAISEGGRVIGVYPENTFSRDVRHRGGIELHLVSSMHERKSAMFNLADAAVALPGGLGTLDEVVELLLWTQLGIHQLPLVLLDVGNFWDKFIGFLDEAVSYGLLNSEFQNSLRTVVDPSSVIEVLDQLMQSRT
ncbi:MAG: TIGR00730 family Rossman fold protein [Acidimicrobiales bacterium]|nr:MAG: TIGR00730 family Rossman fold protein [Acidimicrobiales bacterium]